MPFVMVWGNIALPQTAKAISDTFGRYEAATFYTEIFYIVEIYVPVMCKALCSMKRIYWF